MKLNKLQSLSESGQSTAVDFSDHLEDLRTAGLADEFIDALKKAGVNLLKNGFRFDKKIEGFVGDVFCVGVPRADFFRSDFVKGAGFYFIDENIKICFIAPHWKQLATTDIKDIMKLYEEAKAVAEKRKALSSAAAPAWSPW